MPKPLDGVVDALQAGLKNHWTQILLYETQAAHFARWGYKKLGEAFLAYAEEEREHARKCVQRLEFFDAQPEYVFEEPIWPRHDYEGILEVNYTLDLTAANAERSGYSLCVAVGDAETANIFAELLKGSEDGMAEIEAIRLVIDQIGIDNFLANQT
jgi:bacterioferritin (cytochrome b1)